MRTRQMIGAPLTGLLLFGCPTDEPGRDSGVVDSGIGDLGEDGAGTAGDDDGTGDDGGTGSNDGGTADTGAASDTGSQVDDTGSNDGAAQLIFLSIEPPESIIELDLDQAGNVDFTVTAHYDDGAEADVTDQIEMWTVTNPMVGSMNGASLDIPGFANSFFDSTIVTATIDGEEGNAQVTVAAYTQTGPEQDFFFILPYNDPAGAQDKPLQFSTAVKNLDVFFNMDTTGSMSGPIANLQSSLVTTVIPDIENEIANTEFGAGNFEDFPVPSYGWDVCPVSGTDADQPFHLQQEITSNSANVQNAVNSMSMGNGSPVGCGNDWPEANIESLFQIATGNGLSSPGLTSVASNISGVGGVGFRDGTMPVIVSITDAPSQENGPNCTGASYSGNAGIAAVAATRQEMYDALDAICARVVPVAIGNFDTTCGPLADGTQFATQSGAIIPPEAWDELPGGRPANCASGTCCTGQSGAGVPTDGNGLCPLVYRAASNGSGLDGSIVDGVQMLARYAPFDVTTEVDGVAQDTDGVATPVGTTSADFIVSVTPYDFGPIPVQGVPDPVLTPTTFEGVVPDTDVTFTVEAFNDFVPQGSQPRLFVATIRVLADGCSDLDERDVFILVPPAELPPPG